MGVKEVRKRLKRKLERRKYGGKIHVNNPKHFIKDSISVGTLVAYAIFIPKKKGA